MEKKQCFLCGNFLLRKIVIVFLLCILGNIGIGNTETSLPAASVEYVVNGMKNRESSVSSASATFELKITDELKGGSATNKFQWIMKGNKRYFEQQEVKQKFVETYDGVYLRHYRISSNFGVIEETTGLSETSIVPDMFGFYFYGSPLSKFFEVNKAKLLPKTEKIEDQECYVMEAIGPAPQKPKIDTQTLPNVKIKAWINPRRGFSVVRIEQGFVYNKPSRIYSKIQWKEFDDGIWFPMNGELRGAGVFIQLTVKTIEINIDASEQIFKNPGWKRDTKIWNDMIKKTVEYDADLLK
jgi:hypothetical protein